MEPKAIADDRRDALHNRGHWQQLDFSHHLMIDGGK
jgi:hypothetical protein